MNFYKSIPRSFSYPIRGQGKILFGIGVVIFIMLFLAEASYVLMLAGYLATVIIWGYLVAYFTKMLAHTMEGKDEMPDYPEIVDAKQNIVDPFFRFTFAILVCFGVPVYILVFKDVSTVVETVSSIWVVIGTILFPMIFIRMTIMDSIEGMNPIEAIKVIVKMPLQYASLLAIFYIFLLFTPALSFASYGLIELGAILLLTIGEMYFSCVLMNIMGNFYLANEEKFGWVVEGDEEGG